MAKMGKNKKSATIVGYVIIPSVVILILVTALNFFLYLRELGFFRNIYDNEVVGTTSLLNRRFQSALIAAESTKAFFIGSESVTKDEFDAFASVLTTNIGSGAIAVPLTIEWVDEDNNIRYVYPMNEDNAKIVGLDLNKYPNRLLPITRAKTTKAPVVTEPIILGQGYPGIILYSPIFKDDAYRGEAVVVVRLANLVAPIEGSSPIYNKDEHIQTGGFIIPFDVEAIFNNNGERVANPQGDLVKDSASQRYSASEKSGVSIDLGFADKTWKLKFSPTYLDEVNRRAGIYIAISLIFSIAIISFLWILQRRQERLRAEKARTEALILSIGDGLVACDKDGIITFANQKAEELSGFSKKDSIGKSYYDIWMLLDSKGVRVPLEERLFYRALRNREIVTVSTASHLFVLRKDGTRFPLSSTIAPILVDDKVEGAIVVFRDITKESEVDRMKTEFLSLASHQLLTPSALIKWISELLIAGDYGKLGKKQKESVQTIYNSNEGMIGLVNSLLNVSRIESGRIVVDPKPTSLGELAKGAITEVKGKIDEKKQVFKLKVGARLPKINVDPRLIKEVYKNLLTNAVKYTPEKGRISLDIYREGDAIVSKVADSGYGIPINDKKRFLKNFTAERILLRLKETETVLDCILSNKSSRFLAEKYGSKVKWGRAQPFG